MKKIEIKTIFGAVAFSWESETNTIKETVEKLLKKFRGNLIKEINLSETDLSGIDFSNSRFYNSSFDNSRFYNSSFDNSRFDNSRFYNSSFDNSRFYNSSFDNSRFYNSSFDNSRFYNSRFDNSRFYNSRFYNSRFYNSSFDNSSFDNSSFDKIKIKKINSFIGLYKYQVIVIISNTDEAHIKMGCYFRPLKEWEVDFWNNPSEFPNDNSEKSNLRLFAFETAKNWILKFGNK